MAITVPQLETRILHAVAEAEKGGETAQTSSQDLGRLEEFGKVDQGDIDTAVQRLHRAGYLDGHDASSAAGYYLMRLHLIERGLREVQVWPAEEGLDALLRVIDERLAATDDPEERSRLQKIRDGAKGLAGESLLAIGKAWATYLGGPGSPLF